MKELQIIKCELPLFRQFWQIGDIVKLDHHFSVKSDDEWLILDMMSPYQERYPQRVVVIYLCQNLTQSAEQAGVFTLTDWNKKSKNKVSDSVIEITYTSILDKDVYNLPHVGNFGFIAGRPIKVLETIGSKFNGTDIISDFYARYIEFLSPNEAKSRLLEKRKSELKMTVISMNEFPKTKFKSKGDM